jgi:hypothetical protein
MRSKSANPPKARIYLSRIKCGAVVVSLEGADQRGAFRVGAALQHVAISTIATAAAPMIQKSSLLRPDVARDRFAWRDLTLERRGMDASAVSCSETCRA